MKRLEEYFNEMDDPRQNGKIKHLIGEILTISLCAVASGIESVYEIEEFAQIKEEWLRTQVGLSLKNGIPSHDTIGRVLEIINPKRFQELFIKWMDEALSLESGTYIQLDGKTLKGNGIGEKKGIHLVSAYAHEAGVVLGQIKCKEKSNEITAIPELLELLKLNNAIITIDAMGCQKTIAKAIVKSKCDYVLAVKENHPTMYEEIKEYFALKETEKECEITKTFDLGHGRAETRKYTLSTDINWFEDKKKWANLKAFGKVESSGTRNGVKYSETRYFLMSINDVEEFAKAVRNHWAIENNLHWSLDVIFKDDDCLIKNKITAENMAILRRIAFNRMKMFDNSRLKTKKMKCAFDDNFRYKVLFSNFHA